MRWRQRLLLWLTAGAVLPLASCLGPSDTVTLQGCGATFPAPLYKRWFLEYYRRNPAVRVNFQAIGSGAGIRQFSEGRVHFGATDEALSPKKFDELTKSLSEREGKPVEVIQVPLTAGAIALCYNLPGKPDLKLSRAAYGRMILGGIKTWDDEAIRRTNPGVELPALPITFVRRAEGSGTTFNFSNHLVHVDPDGWKSEGLTAGKSVQWKVGIGGKGNAGVSALIQQTPGALGYIEAGYAALADLPTAALENHAGQFVLPTEEATQSALAEAHFDRAFGATVPDPKGKASYPIVTFTWVLCRKSYADPRVAERLRDVMLYCLGGQKGEGQSFSAELHYAPLPEKTAAQMRKVVEGIGAEPASAGLPRERTGG